MPGTGNEDALVTQTVKRLAYNAGDLGSISGSGRSSGEENGNPLQCSCLENPMNRGAWWATVHWVAKSRTRLSDFTFTFTFPQKLSFWGRPINKKINETSTSQEATDRNGHGTTDWFQIGKGVRQGCILSPCLFNLYAEYIMRNAGLEEAQAGIKTVRRIINNLRYADDTTLMAESEEELKSLLMKVKVESENVGLKLNIQKRKIMASGPIISWQIDGVTVETLADFICLGSKITADGDCSHEIKRRLLLGRKVMTNLDSILKSRDITLPTKGPSSQGYGFSSGHVWI